MSDSNRLRVIRAERRMTQLTLAIVTRIHPTRVWKIENGYVVPRPKERQAIASALGASESVVWPSYGPISRKGLRNDESGPAPLHGYEPGEE